MKKLAILALAAALLTPGVTHAVWWNPFSWFVEQVKPIKEEKWQQELKEISANKPVVQDLRLATSTSPKMGIRASTIVAKPTAVENNVVDHSKELANLNAWVQDIAKERQDLIQTIKKVEGENSLKVLDGYNKKLFDIHRGMVSVMEIPAWEAKIIMFNRWIELYNDANKQTHAQLKLAHDIDMADRISDLKRKARRDYYDELEDEYEELQEERQQIANDRANLYNEIRSNGSREGVTEAVVNAQLKNAGLINGTTCSFSSVGGMTPGSGSMVCY